MKQNIGVHRKELNHYYVSILFTAQDFALKGKKDGFDQVLSLFFGTNIFRKSVKPFKIWKLKTQFEPQLNNRTVEEVSIG